MSREACRAWHYHHLYPQEVIEAAVVQEGRGTVPFPNTSLFGVENIGVGAAREWEKVSTVPIETITIDDLVQTHMGGRRPGILTTDTEGNDAQALFGARETLASGSVGYLEVKHWLGLILALTSHSHSQLTLALSHSVRIPFDGAVAVD